MRKSLILILLFMSLLMSKNIHTHNQTEDFLNIPSHNVTANKILEISNNAIDLCFDNISAKNKTDHFPNTPGPMNSPFPLHKNYEYDIIVGYEFADSIPSVVTFLIGVDGLKGHHLAVVIDLKKMEAIEVYNRPGS